MLQRESSEEEAGGRAGRRGAAMLPEGLDEQDEEEQTECDDDSKGESDKREIYGSLQAALGQIQTWTTLCYMYIGIFIYDLTFVSAYCSADKLYIFR